MRKSTLSLKCWHHCLCPGGLLAHPLLGGAPAHGCLTKAFKLVTSSPFPPNPSIFMNKYLQCLHSLSCGLTVDTGGCGRRNRNWVWSRQCVADLNYRWSSSLYLALSLPCLGTVSGSPPLLGSVCISALLTQGWAWTIRFGHLIPWGPSCHLFTLGHPVHVWVTFTLRALVHVTSLIQAPEEEETDES